MLWQEKEGIKTFLTYLIKQAMISQALPKLQSLIELLTDKALVIKPLITLHFDHQNFCLDLLIRNTFQKQVLRQN